MKVAASNLRARCFTPAVSTTFPGGLIPPEASGWFRKEIKTPADLKGLRMRIFGMGALVMRKLGVVTQQDAPGEIYAKLKDGSLDAAEFSLPAMDQPLKLYEVAKYYSSQAGISRLPFSTSTSILALGMRSTTATKRRSSWPAATSCAR